MAMRTTETLAELGSALHRLSDESQREALVVIARCLSSVLMLAPPEDGAAPWSPSGEKQPSMALVLRLMSALDGAVRRAAAVQDAYGPDVAQLVHLATLLESASRAHPTMSDSFDPYAPDLTTTAPTTTPSSPPRRPEEMHFPMAPSSSSSRHAHPPPPSVSFAPSPRRDAHGVVEASSPLRPPPSSHEPSSPYDPAINSAPTYEDYDAYRYALPPESQRSSILPWSNEPPTRRAPDALDQFEAMMHATAPAGVEVSPSLPPGVPPPDSAALAESLRDTLLSQVGDLRSMVEHESGLTYAAVQARLDQRRKAARESRSWLPGGGGLFARYFGVAGRAAILVPIVVMLTSMALAWLWATYGEGAKAAAVPGGRPGARVAGPRWAEVQAAGRAQRPVMRPGREHERPRGFTWII